MTCNAARLTAALSIFFLAPQDVYLVMLRTDQVGLTKEVNEPKTALGLDKEFANNDGFWYAELPYVIEMTKIYTNDTTLDARTGHFVIRKT
jgi:hypothetical protein